MQFVNSPIVEPDAVEVLVTPRNSFLNGCPSVTYALRRQVFNGLALICAALSQSGRAGQGMACQERYVLRVWVGRLSGGGGVEGEGCRRERTLSWANVKVHECCSARMEPGAVPSQAQESGGGGGWIVYRLAAAQVRPLVPHGTDRPKRSRT